MKLRARIRIIGEGLILYESLKSQNRRCLTPPSLMFPWFIAYSWSGKERCHGACEETTECVEFLKAVQLERLRQLLQRDVESARVRKREDVNTKRQGDGYESTSLMGAIGEVRQRLSTITIATRE